MPEEDDEALAGMLGSRLHGSEDSEEKESDNLDDVDNTDDTGDPKDGETTQDVSNKTPRDTSTGKEAKSDDEKTNKLPQTPMYLRKNLKNKLEDRFKRFNAGRVINGEDEVEKHAHFYHGLIKAGLDNEELEEYVLEEYRDD